MAPRKKLKAKAKPRVPEGETCDYCGRGDKDFRDPKWYPLVKIVDRLDRTNFCYAHKQCIVDAAEDYNNLQRLRRMLKEVLT